MLKQLKLSNFKVWNELNLSGSSLVSVGVVGWTGMAAVTLGARRADEDAGVGGAAEGVNSRIQAVKARCRGFQDRFAAAILFHLGGLDLSPRPAQL